MSSHEHNNDRTEQVVSTLLSAAGKAPVPPDEAFLERLSGETMKAFIAASAQRPKRNSSDIPITSAIARVRSTL